MKQQIQFAEFGGDGGEDARDLLVPGYVARKQEGVRAEGAGKFLDVFLEPFALVGEGERGAGVAPGLGYGPGYGTFVGNADNETDFSLKQ